MNKRLLLLDFDTTLFNNRHLMNEEIFPALVAKFGATAQEYHAVLDSYVKSLADSTEYHPEGYIRALVEKMGVDEGGARAVLFDENHYKNSVFPEVSPTLEVLKNDYRLGIFSQSVPEWQYKKILFTGLMGYFEQDLVLIGTNKTSPEFLAQIPAGTVIVDDRPDMIAALKVRPDLVLVWINRDYKELDLGVPQINLLSELPALLLKV